MSLDVLRQPKRKYFSVDKGVMAEGDLRGGRGGSGSGP